MKQLAVLSLLFVIAMLSCDKEKGLPQVTDIDEILPKDDFTNTMFEIANTCEDFILDKVSREHIRQDLDRNCEFRIQKIFDERSLKGAASFKQEFENLNQSFILDEIKYEPIIYVPNMDVADPALSPIIAIGVEVEYRGTDLSGDVIIGWYYDTNDEKQVIYLDENLATTIKRPVFIVTNGDCTHEILEQNKETDYVKKGALETTGSPAPIIDEYRIIYRYESSGDSDYNFRLIYVYENGSSQEGVRDLIRSINKDHIGYTWGDDHELWQFSYLSNLSRGYVVTYERDFYTGKKTITWQDGFSATCARMVSSSEWYQKFWVDYVDGGSPTTYPGNYVSSKGHVRIKY